MSWSTEAQEEPGGAELIERDAAARTFPEDTGELPLETRRALVQLLLGPAVDGQRHTKLWPVLLRDERALRSRLHELFLELVIDRDQQVAYTRQVVDPELEIPVLLRKMSLTFLQSALVLFLREQLILAEARGERAVVSRAELIEHLCAYEPAHNRDQAKFGKQAAGAVERAKELNLLRKLRGAEERFEVSPTLKLLFAADQIQGLTATYQELVQRGGVGDERGTEPDHDDQEEA